MMKIQLGKYEHYKGHHYRVLFLAKHSETLEDMVVYEALYENDLGKIWVRPLTMFIENVDVNGTMMPRFKYIDSQSQQ